MLKAGDVALGGRKLDVPDGHIKGGFRRKNLFTDNRDLQNKVMDVVKHLQNNGGERFLRDVNPDQVQIGWDLAQELNLNAIKASKIAQTEFYELVGN